MDPGRPGAPKRKNCGKKQFLIHRTQNDIPATSARRASLWASLKKFDFLATSKSSRYLGEAALKSFTLFTTVKIITKLNLGHSDKFEIKI